MGADMKKSQHRDTTLTEHVSPGVGEVISNLLHHRVDSSSGSDHDHIQVRWRRNKLVYHERALQLDRRVVGVLQECGSEETP